MPCMPSQATCQREIEKKGDVRSEEHIAYPIPWRTWLAIPARRSSCVKDKFNFEHA